MTDRSPDPERAPRPDEVRRSLRALADGSTPPRDSDDGPTTVDAAPARRESVVADAERAVECAREAASFLSTGRLSELDRATAAATRHGDDDVARRGRAAQESLRRLDAALHGNETTDSGDEAGGGRSDGDREPRPGTAEQGRNASPATDPQPRNDHFHSGRGTVLGDTAQDAGR